MVRRSFCLLLSTLFLFCGCSTESRTTESVARDVSKQESQRQAVEIESELPVAVDPAKVGTYPMLAKSGGRYFYDEVLEYRVWVDSPDGDTYRAFASIEEAREFSEATSNAEPPLVLVLQKEHVNEPETGVFEHVRGDRITEWRVEWLSGNKRSEDSIPEFLRTRGQ